MDPKATLRCTQEGMGAERDSTRALTRWNDSDYNHWAADTACCTDVRKHVCGSSSRVQIFFRVHINILVHSSRVQSILWSVEEYSENAHIQSTECIQTLNFRGRSHTILALSIRFSC